MKKLLTIMTLALALCLICGVALATSEYKVDYEFKDATDFTTKSEVTVNGEIYVIVETDKITKKADHDDGLNRAWATGRNKNTGELVRLECTLLSTHETETKITTAATCGEAGVRTIKCKDCGITREERIAPTGLHTLVKHTVSATCQTREQTGEKWCNVCKKWIEAPTEGKYYGGEDQPNKVHKFPHEVDKMKGNVANFIVTAPSCTNGLAWNVKEVCIWCKSNDTKKVAPGWDSDTLGATVKAYVDFMFSQFKVDCSKDMDSDGHVWDAAKTIKANCYHGDGEIKWCKNCSVYAIVETSEPADPVWTVVKNLTCKAGTCKVYCANCKGAAGGHTSDFYAGNDGMIDAAYTVTQNDQVKNTAIDKSSKYVPSVTAKITFTWNRLSHLDGTVKTTANIQILRTVDHTFNLPVGAPRNWDTDKDAAYTTETSSCAIAVYQGYRCDCGASGIKYVLKTAAPGHVWSQWELYDDGEGKTDTKRYERICSKCLKREIKAIEGEPKPVHNTDAEHTWKVDPDYKYECGKVQDIKMVCDCGATKTDYEVDVKHAPGAYTETVVKAATCKEAGLQHNVCTNCKLDEYVVIKKTTEHAWDEGKITKAATKEADGVKTFTCKDCGTTKTEAVKYVVTADPKYTLTADYAGGVVAGKLTHVEDTMEASAKYVRVTFYIGTYYMATTAEVEADGTYAVEGVGPIDYITVVPTGNSAVNPDEVQRIGEAEEIFVK